MTAGAGRPATSSLVNPREDHPEAITLGLHDASPQHMVDAMADDVVLELGWGRLIFGQTFADPDKLAEVLRQEGQGRRDISMYAREPQVLVALAPAELFIDPSHTYRLRFSDDDSDASPAGFTVRTLESADDADAMNRVYLRCGMVSAPVDVIWDNHLHREPVDYLVAVRDDDGTVVGTVTGVDHKRLFSDPENGSSLWTLAVDPTSSLPGVGAALTLALAAIYRDRRRAYMDLSVAHDNAAAIALYEKLGFARVPVMAVSARTRSTNRCSLTRRRRSTTSIRTRASSPTKQCAAVSGWRCSTPRRVRCGCRTAGAASLPESPCRSSHRRLRWPGATTNA